MSRLALLALLLALSPAATSRPAQVIPAAGPALPGAVLRMFGESDPERTGPAAEATGGPASAPVALLPSRVAEVKAWALRMLGARQYDCLDAVVMRESRWNPLARNPVSGAFGIPQALHGLTSTDPMVQVKWMLRYIERRYGTACRAWAHVQRFSWY